MALFLKANLLPEHKYSLNGLIEAPLNPLMFCRCEHTPLPQRKDILDRLKIDIPKLESADKPISTLFFGSGHLGNETVISFAMLKMGFSHHTFSLLDPIYPDAKADRTHYANEHAAKSQLAFQSRIQLESEVSSKLHESPITTTVNFFRTNDEFYKPSTSPTQVFIMIDPGDAFTFSSKMAKDFRACIESNKSNNEPILIYILARGCLYSKRVEVADTKDIFDFS